MVEQATQLQSIWKHLNDGNYGLDHKLPVFQVRAVHLVVYLQYVSEVASSKAALDNAFKDSFCRGKGITYKGNICGCYIERITEETRKTIYHLL